MEGKANLEKDVTKNPASLCELAQTMRLLNNIPCSGYSSKAKIQKKKRQE